jgi:hypothetical protein
MMEQMALKDYSQYKEAAEDQDVGGGVALPNLLNDDDGGSDNGISLIEPMVPQVVSKARIAIEQQTWPSLQASAQAAGKHLGPAVSSTLEENMKRLAIKHGVHAKVWQEEPSKLINDDDDMVPMPWPAPKPQEPKIVVTPWPLTADYKKGDPLPKAPAPWATGAAAKELFKDAKATPVTPDWEARLRGKEKADHQSNLLHHQFWNPEHEDYDPERFYDPMIERYKCPFPGCE